jgi:antitoxin ParD1/3/4
LQFRSIANKLGLVKLFFLHSSWVLAMQITLTPEIEQFFRDELATGRYRSENEILLEAMQLLSARDRRLEQLRAQVQIGRDQLHRGEFVEFDEAGLAKFFQGLQERGRQRYAERHQKS